MVCFFIKVLLRAFLRFIYLLKTQCLEQKKVLRGTKYAILQDKVREASIYFYAFSTAFPFSKFGKLDCTNKDLKCASQDLLQGKKCLETRFQQGSKDQS